MRTFLSILLAAAGVVASAGAAAAQAVGPWPCTAQNGSGISAAADLLATGYDDKDYKAGGPDCRCGLPLTLVISHTDSTGTPDDVALLASGATLQASCAQGAAAACSAAPVTTDGPTLLLPYTGTRACNSTDGTVTITLADSKGQAQLTCAVPLAQAFQPSFAMAQGALLRISGGSLALYAPQVDMAATLPSFQVLCRQSAGTDMPGQVPVGVTGGTASFSACRQRTQLLRGSGQTVFTPGSGEALVADMTGGTDDMSDGGTPDLTSPGADLTERTPDAAGLSLPAAWDPSAPDPGFLCFTAFTEASTGTIPSVSLSNLTNGLDYDFMVVAADDRGNATTVAQISGAPQVGAFPGPNISGCGCQVGQASHPLAVPPAAAALLLLPLAALLRRRRRPLALALGLGPVLLLPAAARADPLGIGVAFKFGTYAPNLDATSGINGSSYAALLGGSSSSGVGHHLLSQIELSYLPMHGRWGQFGGGFAIGYASMSGSGDQTFITASGQSLTCQSDSSGNLTLNVPGVGPRSVAAADCSGGQQVTLKVAPMSFLLIYRMDAWDRYFDVPIIPYVKAGLGYDAFWWSGANITALSGASAGLVVLPGIAFNLGRIDPNAMIAMRQELGVHRVTLAIEFSYRWINGFGAQADTSQNPPHARLSLTDIDFNAGLNIEF